MSEDTHQNCKHLLGNISEYIDGELSEELCREIEKHLEDCENCRIVLNTTRRTIDLVQVSPNAEALPVKVRERLFKRLNLDDYIPPK